MSDIHQNESLRRKPTKKRGRAQRRSEQSPTFDPKDIAQGKKLVATLKANDATLKSTQAAIDSAEMKLGKLADGQKPIYGDRTLAEFAKVLDISFNRLNRCRSVYRAYKDNEIKGPAPKFGVLQALQGHPNRDEIIRERPDLTRREARTFMKDYHKAQGTQENWRVRDTRGWWNQVKKHAQETIQYGHPKQEYLDPKIMGLAIDDWDITERSFDLASQTFATLRDEMKRLRPLAFPKPPLLLPRPMFDDQAPSEAPQNEAKPDNAIPDEAAQTDASDEDNATPDQAT